MNPKSLLFVLPAILLFVSCSKESSFEKRKDNPDETGPLLIKTTTQSSAASYTIATTFSYDAQKRLLNLKNNYEGTINEPYAEQETSFIRNNKGAVTTIFDIWNIYDEDDILTLQDSITLNLNVTAEGKYTYGIRAFLDPDNKTIRDSIAYGYNGKGRINKVEIFRKKGNANFYEAFQKTDYTYDENSNITITTIRFFENIQDPVQEISFTYNDKIAPMNFKDEALLSGFFMEGFNSPHCLTGIKDITAPDNNWTIKYDEYNKAEKPVKATYTNLTTQEKINVAYFYQ